MMPVQASTLNYETDYGLPPVMTVEEVAEFLRLNVKTVYLAIDGGSLPAKKFGKRIVILRDALLDCLRSEACVSSRSRRS